MTAMLISAPRANMPHSERIKSILETSDTPTVAAKKLKPLVRIDELHA